MHHRSLSPHEVFMQRAIQLARRGAGFVESNPMVGAVMVRQGKIIGESYHAKFGGAHAERRLLQQVTKRYGPAALKTATLYCTLEPCNHQGKTPPCLDVVLSSGVGTVVIGTPDPNPRVCGQSIKRLKRVGRKVVVGVAETDCRYLIRTFAKFITIGRPYILAKVGMSADGKITPGTTRQYITNAASLARVHELRQEFSGIMVGVNTILHDDPRLDTRLSRRQVHHPVKIILDSRLRTPPHSRALDEHTIIACLPQESDRRKRQLAKTGAEIIEIPPSNLSSKQLFDQMSITTLLEELGRRNISSVLLEGGSFLFTTFINRQAIDEFYIFIAPELYGATHLPFTYALKYTVTLTDPHFETLDDNLLLRGYASYAKVPNYRRSR